jgi:GNAT superfamily N-acetyltransferase
MPYSVKAVRDLEEAERLADAHAVFFEESLYRKLTFDRARTVDTFMSMMLDSDFHTLIAYAEDGSIAGYNVFAFERNCSVEEVVLGVWFYVLPQHRRSQCSQMLVDAELKICKDRGAMLNFTSSTAGFSDNGCNERAYTGMRVRNGFRKLGTFLVRELSHEQSQEGD